MKPVAWAAAIAVLLLVQAGCGDVATPRPARQPMTFDPAAFSGEAALAEVRQLVERGPRVATTAGAGRAADYLADRFRQLGLEVEVDEFQDAVPAGTGVFRNVIARIPGASDRMVVLGSHFDTKAGISDAFVGANDSGSSTGALLELARVMRAATADLRPDVEFIFVAFDGEEAAVRYGPRDGFHGSRRFVERLEASGRLAAVQAMILLDMIGDRDLTVTIPRNCTPELVEMALNAARDEGARSAFSLYPRAIGDDHVPFLDAGVPAVNLIDFEFGSGPGRNDYWHTEHDTLDKISADSLQVVGRVTLRIVNRLLADPPLPPRS